MGLFRRRKPSVKQRLALLESEFNNFRYDIEHNGVANAINKLNQEVFKDTKDSHGHGDYMRRLWGIDPQKVPTLKATVEAILEHLGIEVEVRETSASQKIRVKAPKKKTTTKKGKK